MTVEDWTEKIGTAFDEELLRCEIVLKSLKQNMLKIPSADRPQGEWVTEFNGNGWNDFWDYTCSNCGKKYERADNILYKSNFCPNCGARMKEVVNDIG